MLLQIILLVVGFVVLIKGADFFVDGASSTAQNFKVSKMLIGLTIVAFGTSAPEFAVSVKALLSGNGDMVLGNVIGSNILNILLILGISALVHSLTVKNNTVKKELPITLMITTLFAVLLSDHFFDTSLPNSFTRSDGVVLLLFFHFYLLLQHLDLILSIQNFVVVFLFLHMSNLYFMYTFSLHLLFVLYLMKHLLYLLYILYSHPLHQ